MANDAYDEAAIYRRRLSEYIERIPETVCNGSWNVACDYKRWYEDARKAPNNPRSGRAVLMGLCNRYDRFKERGLSGLSTQ